MRGMGVSWVFFASFAMIFLGVILMAIASFTSTQGTASGGAVILIGPIPIVLGSGPESTWLILAAAIITVVSLVAFLLRRKTIYR
jgi:uncharacterized membrane protein